MNIKIIVNPRAGGGKAKDIGYTVESFLCGRGIEYSQDITYRPGGATSLSKKAIEGGYDLIIAVGGDGTVNEVLNGMIGSDAELAVIPAGKRNDFSKMLGLDPKNIKEACEIAIGSYSKKLDAGLVNGRYFFNGIGFGLNAALSGGTSIKAPANSTKKPFLLRLFSVLTKFSAPRLNIKTDTQNFERRFIMAKVANGRHFGSGFAMAPNADPMDGLLDICLINDTGKVKFLFNLPRLIKGTHEKLSSSVFLRAPKLSISSHDPVAVVCDGEPLDIASVYEISIADKKVAVKSK